MALNASVRIEAACRQGKTYLKEGYCTQPFKIADITEDRQGKTLRLMLMSASPGVLDGDRYTIKIQLEEEADLHLQTQSYQRLFPMQKGASQDLEVRLKRGASFTYLPHPSVPHEGASFVSRNRIFLEEGCRLVWGEILSCGRKLNGEVFRFRSYRSCTEIRVNDWLRVKENLLLEGGAERIGALGQMEGYTHQASLMLIDEKIDASELTGLFLPYLEGQPGITFGLSALPVNGLLVRILGQKGEQLRDLLEGLVAIRQTTGSKTFKKNPVYVP